MANKNPQDAARKWAQRLASASQDIAAGVNGITEAPTAKAARNKAKWQARLQQAMADGTWEASLNNVTLADWKRAFSEKGIPRIAQGAQAAQGDMASFLGELLPYQEQVRSELEQMPDMTLEDAIARQAAWTRRMSQFRRRAK